VHSEKQGKKEIKKTNKALMKERNQKREDKNEIMFKLHFASF